MIKNLTAAAVILLFISCQNDDRNAKFFKQENQIIADAELTNSDTSTFIQSQKEKERQKPEDKKKSSPENTFSEKRDWDKKIIKTASLRLEIEDYNNYNTSLREKVKQVGGYVAQEEQSQSDYKIENSLIIKVPVDQFDNTLNLFATDADKIEEKKISSQDVTSEVIDTRSRLEAKRQVRLRYLDLLKQAKNMEEILNVQNEINDIQEQIESATGRIGYLNHAAAMSTINLSFYQVLNATAKDSDMPTFGAKLSNAFKSGWTWVGEVFIGLVSIWPLLLIVFAAFILYKKIRAPKAKQA